MKKYLTKEEVRQEYQEFCDEFNKENNLVLFNGLFVQEGNYFAKDDGILSICFNHLNIEQTNKMLDKFFKDHHCHEINTTNRLILDTSNKYSYYIS